MTLLAAVGLRAEAALLPPHVRPIVSGGDPARLRALLATAGEEASAVLSFGIAGALDPVLGPGDLIVASEIRDASATWGADAGWASALAAATGGRLATVAGADAVVAEPAAKHALRVATGAVAVDLESAVAAAWAASRALPFAALRAVADTAAETVPLAAIVGLAADGRPAPLRVVLALLRRPYDLPALLTVARRARTALAALERAAKALPPSPAR